MKLSKSNSTKDESLELTITLSVCSLISAVMLCPKEVITVTSK